MSYKTPKVPTPEKPLDPVINMAEMRQATDLQKNQRGFLSTYLQGAPSSKYRLSDYLEGSGRHASLAATAQSKTLGDSGI